MDNKSFFKCLNCGTIYHDKGADLMKINFDNREKCMGCCDISELNTELVMYMTSKERE